MPFPEMFDPMGEPKTEKEKAETTEYYKQLEKDWEQRNNRKRVGETK